MTPHNATLCGRRVLCTARSGDIGSLCAKRSLLRSQGAPTIYEPRPAELRHRKNEEK